MVTLMNLNEAC